MGCGYGPCACLRAVCPGCPSQRCRSQGCRCPRLGGQLPQPGSRPPPLVAATPGLCRGCGDLQSLSPTQGVTVDPLQRGVRAPAQRGGGGRTASPRRACWSESPLRSPAGGQPLAPSPAYPQRLPRAPPAPHAASLCPSGCGSCRLLSQTDRQTDALWKGTGFGGWPCCFLLGKSPGARLSGGRGRAAGPALRAARSPAGALLQRRGDERGWSQRPSGVWGGLLGRTLLTRECL